MFVLSGKDEDSLHETSLHSVISVLVSDNGLCKTKLVYMNVFHMKFLWMKKRQIAVWKYDVFAVCGY